MKTLIRNIVLNSICLWLIALTTGAISYSNRSEILFFAGVSLSMVNFLVKPFLNLIFLPLNLITLGTFRWVINFIVLFLVTILVEGFKIQPFVFKGLDFAGFVIPEIKFTLFLSYLLVSFLLNFISGIIYWIFK